MYAGQEKGWKIAGDLHMCKVGNPIVLIADTAYAEKNPEITAKFLSIYLRAVNMLQKEPLESLVPEYQRFFLEWAGKNYSPNCPSPTSRRTPSTTWKNSSPCLILPRA